MIDKEARKRIAESSHHIIKQYAKAPIHGDKAQSVDIPQIAPNNEWNEKVFEEKF